MFRVADASGATVERTATLYANLINLPERGWPSLGSLDDAVLVVAALDPAFDGFRLWRVAPADGSLVANATDPGDFELELRAGGQALHALGVLDLDETQGYALALRSGTAAAPMVLELLIDGVVVSTRAPEYAADDPEAAGAVFDLSGAHLSAFRPGVSTVALRITNASADAVVRLDDFALSGARILRIEQIGSDSFETAGLSGASRSAP